MQSSVRSINKFYSTLKFYCLCFSAVPGGTFYFILGNIVIKCWRWIGAGHLHLACYVCPLCFLKGQGLLWGRVKVEQVWGELVNSSEGILPARGQRWILVHLRLFSELLFGVLGGGLWRDICSQYLTKHTDTKIWCAHKLCTGTEC